MIIYHQVGASSLDSILRYGIKRSSGGRRSQDGAVSQTNQYLDQRRPQGIVSKKLSRADNIYGYVKDGRFIVDIINGKLVPIEKFINQSEDVLIKLEVDPDRCYVSDLDAYDRLKVTLEGQGPGRETERLAANYWQAIVSLSSFTPGQIERPEVMVTYDLPASRISKVP